MAWSSSSWSWPISSISSSVYSVSISVRMALYRSTLALISPKAPRMFSRTVLSSSSSGSCIRIPTEKPGVMNASPFDGVSMPAMIFRMVDLPAPFGPTTPILAPG